MTAIRKFPKIPANPIPTTTSRPSEPRNPQPEVRFRPFRSLQSTRTHNQALRVLRFSQSELAARSATLLAPKGASWVPSASAFLWQKPSAVRVRGRHNRVPWAQARGKAASRSETMEHSPRLVSATPSGHAHRHPVSSRQGPHRPGNPKRIANSLTEAASQHPEASSPRLASLAPAGLLCLIESIGRTSTKL